jgi:transposase-like protein
LTDSHKGGGTHGIKLCVGRKKKNYSVSDFTGYLIQCPKCGSKDTDNNGFNKNKNEIVQCYKCAKCGHLFSDNSRIEKMKNKLNMIKKAVELQASGGSQYKNVEKLKKIGISISRRTLGTWYKKYKDDYQNKNGLWDADFDLINLDGRWISKKLSVPRKVNKSSIIINYYSSESLEVIE